MPDLSSGRRTAATALLDAMGDPGKVVDRGTILPLGTYEDGSTGLAWPSVLYDPVKSVGRLWDNAPAAADPTLSQDIAPQIGEDVFNIAGSVGLGGVASPKPQNAVGMFGGRLAKTADHNALARAEKLAAEGAPREQIWNETGWFKGVDGNWRFEIDDSGSSISNYVWGEGWRDEGLLDWPIHPSRETLRHNNLYDAYPGLGEKPMLVKRSDDLSYAGANAEDMIAAEGPTIGGVHSTALHETQHSLQHLEGFYSNPSVKSHASPTAQHTLFKLAKAAYPDIAKELDSTSWNLLPWYKKLFSNKADVDAAGARAWQAYNKLNDLGHQNAASEVEARTVETRRALSPKDRRDRPPWLDYDVPESNQLYANSRNSSLPYLAGQAVDNSTARAALGSGLPMDQASRLARAREMGFDTDNVLYHGTHPSNVGPGGETRYRAADFESFDSGFLGDNSGLTPGFSFSSSPENASGYAGLNSIVEWNKEFNSKLAAAYDKAYGKKRLSKDQRTLAIRDHADLVKKAHESDMNDPSIATWKDTQIEGGAVYPVHVRHGRQMVIDAEGALWKNINGTRVQELAKKAKEDGYDSLVVKNVRDAGNARQASQGLLSDTTIVFDSKNIRSVNAAFDPAMSDSANLLAANGRNSSLPYLTGQALDNRAASALLDEGPKGFTAYHGSPHDFDKFDMSKIGTGEGAQAYGHGLYFAESEGVAQSYRDGLSPGSFAIDGTSVQQTAMPWLKEYMTRDDKSLASVLTRINNGISSRESRRSSLAKEKGNKTAAHIGESLKKEIEIERNRADALRSYLNEKQDANAGWNSNGHMYQVRINANPDDFLDWDKPLSQQPRAAEILKSLQLPMGAIDDLGGDVSLLHNSEMPREFYDALSSLSGVGDVSGASKLIGEAGIPGIKYLDQGSRTAGEGSRNYVLFRDDIIDIVKKYGIAAAALMYGEQAVQSAMDSGASVQTDY